ncbi:MAG: GTP-binding protein [Thiolinea sp.]
MTSQQAFERTKPTIHIATIGHAGHGKSTLTTALSNVLARTYGGQARSYEDIANPSEEQLGGITLHASRVEYDTPSCHYVHLDCPAQGSDVNTMLTSGTLINGVILVVSVTHGLTPQTREQVQLANQSGIPYIICYLNHCDLMDDEEALVLMEIEMRELLSEYDFPGDHLPVIRGSALKALEGLAEWEDKIIELASHLDTYTPHSA